MSEVVCIVGCLSTHISRIYLCEGVGAGLSGHVYWRCRPVHEQVRLNAHLHLHTLVEQLWAAWTLINKYKYRFVRYSEVPFTLTAIGNFHLSSKTQAAFGYKQMHK